jgi:NodT family efflux transporter outer membrane factor (OMF) lipoprotein
MACPPAEVPAQRRSPARAATGAALAALLALVAGCAAPPTTEPTRVAALAAVDGVDADDRLVAAPPGAPAPTDGDLRWWTRFGDPALAGWVERALATNLDLAEAATRVDEARAALRAAQGARGPQVAAEARLDARSRAGAGGRRVEPSAALTLDWDADLWGGLRDAARAAESTLAGRGFEARALALSTAALTARAYVGWQEARLDGDAQRQALALWRETARVVQVRVDAGLSPRLDGLRAQGEVAAAEAALVAAGTRLRETERALQLLAGDRPGRPLDSDRPPRLPGAPGAPGAGGAQGEAGTASADGSAAAALPMVLPLDLLRLRPDLRAAEQALRAAEAVTGAAAAAERPSLRLPGIVTLGTGGSGALLATLTAGIAAELAAPLFDGGQRAAATEAAEARARAAAIAYRRALQQALAQTEAAFVAHADAQRGLAAQTEASRAADAAEAQARILYDNGLVGFLDLLEAQRDALARRQDLRRQQADLVRGAIAAFEAMGLLPEDVPAVVAQPPPRFQAS